MNNYNNIRLAFCTIDFDNGGSCGSKIIPEEWSNVTFLSECDRILGLMERNKEIDTFCCGEEEEVKRLTKKYGASALHHMLNDYFENWGVK